jgi:hypothetical protein
MSAGIGGGYGDFRQPMINPVYEHQAHMAALRGAGPMSGQRLPAQSGIGKLPDLSAIDEGITNAVANHKTDFWAKVKLAISSLFSMGSVAAITLISLGVILSALTLATPVGWALAGVALVLALIALINAMRKDSKATGSDEQLKKLYMQLDQQLAELNPHLRGVAKPEYRGDSQIINNMKNAIGKVIATHNELDMTEYLNVKSEYSLLLQTLDLNRRIGPPSA